MAREFAKAFYRSDAWQDMRAYILHRDLYTCTCGARANEVHHIIELTPLNIHDTSIALNPENLVSLCHECHTKITNKNHHADCDGGFFFDSDGFLQRTPPGDYLK